MTEAKSAQINPELDALEKAQRTAAINDNQAAVNAIRNGYFDNVERRSDKRIKEFEAKCDDFIEHPDEGHYVSSEGLFDALRELVKDQHRIIREELDCVVKGKSRISHPTLQQLAKVLDRCLHNEYANLHTVTYALALVLVGIVGIEHEQFLGMRKDAAPFLARFKDEMLFYMYEEDTEVYLAMQKTAAESMKLALQAINWKEFKDTRHEQLETITSFENDAKEGEEARAEREKEVETSRKRVAEAQSKVDEEKAKLEGKVQTRDSSKALEAAQRDLDERKFSLLCDELELQDCIKANKEEREEFEARYAPMKKEKKSRPSPY